ncbi:MAG: hypothetical protein NVSMB19_06700 [Vulcanimicrobiaceae bacterium]
MYVLALHGDIDISQKQWLERELSCIKRIGPRSAAIVDLSDVRYLDTTFLNAFSRIQRYMRKKRPDANVCVVAPRDGFFPRMLEITNLSREYRMFPDMPSARRFAASAEQMFR